MTLGDQLPMITLAELTAVAALQTRVDRKYVLPSAVLPTVINAAPGGTRMLQIDGLRQQRYLSRYFDTDGFDSFLTAGRSRRRRFKVRTRAYVDGGGEFLEVKTRAGRGMTIKQRIPYPMEINAIDADGARFVDDCLTGARIPKVRAADLAPTLITGYRRSTLLMPDDTRATIDTDLAWTRIGGGRLRRPALAIVETKTGSTPSPFDRLLWRYGYRPLRISKYGVGLAALEAGLPPLKWHHTLARRLDLPRSTSLPIPTPERSRA